MTTRQDLNTYVDATIDKTATGTDSNKAYDTKTIAGHDANAHDAIRTNGGDDLVKAGDGNDGNDYVRTDAGDDNVGGKEDHDVLKLGSGDDRAFGGDGDDFIAGGRGNDFMDGGDGNNIFGAVNGSYIVRTGDGEDTIIVSYKQDKMEDRAGNDSGHADAEGEDHFTTVSDFDLGYDTLHMTGLTEKKAFKTDGDGALTKLIFDVGKDGTMITDQNGNKIVYLRDVQVDDVESFMTNNMDFGKFDWKGVQLETLMKGADASGEIREDGTQKLVNFKDRSADYAEFDFADHGKDAAFQFFHGDDGHLSAEARAVFSGSSIKETEMVEFMTALAAGVEGLTVRNVTEGSLTLDVHTDAHGGVTDTIVFSGDVVQDNIDLL